jgi:hypothetical protein
MSGDPFLKDVSNYQKHCHFTISLALAHILTPYPSLVFGVIPQTTAVLWRARMLHLQAIQTELEKPKS